MGPTSLYLICGSQNPRNTFMVYFQQKIYFKCHFYNDLMVRRNFNNKIFDFNIKKKIFCFCQKHKLWHFFRQKFVFITFNIVWEIFIRSVSPPLFQSYTQIQVNFITRTPHNDTWQRVRLVRYVTYCANIHILLLTHTIKQPTKLNIALNTLNTVHIAIANKRHYTTTKQRRNWTEINTKY